MKALIARLVITLAVATSFTIVAEANPVPQTNAVSITVANSVSSVGVLAGK